MGAEETEPSGWLPREFRWRVLSHAYELRTANVCLQERQHLPSCDTGPQSVRRSMHPGYAWTASKTGSFTIGKTGNF